MKNLLFLLIIISAVFVAGCDEFTLDFTTGCKSELATNYDPNATYHDLCLCEFDGIVNGCGAGNPNSMNIPAVYQQTEVWCWLAVGEMIFKHFGLPTVNPGGDFQCGIVAAVGYSLNGGCDACNANCGNCVRPAGEPQMVSYMLSSYPKVACRDLYESNTSLQSSFVSNYLSDAFLINQLNQNKPVIAGINPGSHFVLPGTSMHVALITGYYIDGSNILVLKVNDPYPYWTKGVDPYFNAGAVANGDMSYTIYYQNFVNGLLWNTSWYDIGF